MENILPVVFLGEVDIIEEEGEVFEESLGEVHVYRGPHEETDVEHGLSHTATTLHQPTMLGVFLRKFLPRVVTNHHIQQLRVLELEVESGVPQGEDLWELLARWTISVPETCHVDTVDPLSLNNNINTINWTVGRTPYLPSVVKILRNFHPYGVIQLFVVLTDHGLLTEVDQQSLQLQTRS